MKRMVNVLFAGVLADCTVLWRREKLTVLSNLKVFVLSHWLMG